MPRLVNLGAININSITNNSMLTVGDGSNGETLSQRKTNKGFGVITGNSNIVVGNVNLVYDPDVMDQNNSLAQYRSSPSFSVSGPTS